GEVPEAVVGAGGVEQLNRGAGEGLDAGGDGAIEDGLALRGGGGERGLGGGEGGQVLGGFAPSLDEPSQPVHGGVGLEDRVLGGAVVGHVLPHVGCGCPGEGGGLLGGEPGGGHDFGSQAELAERGLELDGGDGVAEPGVTALGQRGGRDRFDAGKDDDAGG